jgi:hypothetical protein
MKQEIKFIYESKYTDEFVGHCGSPHKIEHTISGETDLTELLEKFTYFVKGMGYYPPENSTLEFVPNDDDQP